MTNSSQKKQTVRALSLFAALTLLQTTLAASSIKNCDLDDGASTCLICSSGYGLYNDGKNPVTCQSCSDNKIQSIPKCTRCNFMLTGATKSVNCVTCSDGFYAYNSFDYPKDPKNWNKKCVACTNSCTTCTSARNCLTCSGWQAIGGNFNNICVLSRTAMYIIVGILLVVAVVTFVLIQKFCCSKVNDMQTPYRAADISAGNYVDVNQVMRRPQGQNQVKGENQAAGTGGF